MADSTWENVLIDWINCLKLSAQIERLEDLADCVFFNNLRKLLKKSSDIAADDLTFIFQLLSRHYPNIKINNKTSIHIVDLPHQDLVEIVSLLLHYTCIYDRRNVLTTSMCHNLSSVVQYYIRQFLEKTTSSVNNQELDIIIKNIFKNNNTLKPPTVTAAYEITSGGCSKNLFNTSISPLQDILKTPAASKNIKLFEKDKEIERLKNELEMEKCDKIDLNKELNEVKLIVSKLEMKLKQKLSENNRLKCEMETLQCEQPLNVNKQNEENRRLLTIEMENSKLYIKQLEDEQEQMQIDRDKMQMRLKKIETDNTMWQQKFFEIEDKFQYYFDLSEELRSKNETLEKHCSELESFLEEYRSGSLSRSFEESFIENAAKRRSSGCNFIHPNEDLAHTVIDLQLKDTEKKLADATDKLDVVLEEKNEIEGKLATAEEHLKTTTLNYELKIDELKVEIKALHEKESLEFAKAEEKCNNLNRENESLLAKYENKEKELKEIEQHVKQQSIEMKRINANLEVISDKLVNSESILSQMKSELDGAQIEIKLKNETIEELTEKNTKLADAIKSSTQENDRLKKYVENTARELEVIGEQLCNTEYTLKITTTVLSWMCADVDSKQDEIVKLENKIEKLNEEIIEQGKAMKILNDKNNYLNSIVELTIQNLQVILNKFVAIKIFFNNRVSYVSLKCSSLEEAFNKVKSVLNKEKEKQATLERTIKERDEEILEMDRERAELEYELLEKDSLGEALGVSLIKMDIYKDSEEMQQQRLEKLEKYVYDLNRTIDGLFGELIDRNDELMVNIRTFVKISKENQELLMELNNVSELFGQLEAEHKVVTEERNNYYQALENCTVDVCKAEEELKVKIEVEETLRSEIRLYEAMEEELDNVFKDIAVKMEERDATIQQMSLQHQHLEANNTHLLNSLQETQQALNQVANEKVVLSNFLELNSNELTNVIQQKDEILEALEMSNQDKSALQLRNNEIEVKLLEIEHLKIESEKLLETRTIEINEFKRKFNELSCKYEDEVKELQIQLINDIEEFAKRKRAYKILKASNQQLEEQLKEKEEMVNELVKKNEQINKDFETHNQKLENTIEKLQKAEQDIKISQQEETVMKNKIKMYEEDANENQKRLNEITEELQLKDNEIKIIKEQMQNLTDKLETMRKLYEANDTELNEYKNQFESTTEKLVTVQQKLKESLEENQLKITSIEEQSSEIEKMKKSLEEGDIKMLQLLEENKQINEERNDYYQKLENAVEKLQKVEEDLENKQREETIMQNKIRIYEEEAEKNQKQLIKITQILKIKNTTAEQINFDVNQKIEELLSKENEIKNVKDEVQNLTDKLETTRKLYEANNTELIEYKNQLKSITDKSETVQQKLKESLEENRKKITSIEGQSTEIEKMNKNLEEKDIEILQLLEENKQINGERNAYYQKLENALEKLQKVEEDIKNTQQAATVMENTMKIYEEEAEENQNKITEKLKIKDATVQQINSVLNQKIEELQSKENEIKKVNEEMQILTEQLATTKQLYEVKDNAFNEYKNQLESITKQMEVIQWKLTESLEEIKKRIAVIEEQSTEIEKMNKNLEQKDLQILQLLEENKQINEERNAYYQKLENALEKLQKVEEDLENSQREETIKQKKIKIYEEREKENQKQLNEISKLLKVKNDTTEKMCNDLKQKIEEKIQKLTNKLETTKKLYESKACALNKYEIQLESMTKQFETIQQKLTESLDENQKKAVTIEKHAIKFEEINRNLEEKKVLLDQLEVENKQINEERNDYYQKMEKLEEILKNRQQEETVMQNMIKIYEKREEENQKQLFEINEELKIKNETVQQTSFDLNQKIEELQSKEDEIKKIKEAMENLTGKFELMKKLYEANDNTLNEFKSQLASTTEKLEASQQMLTESLKKNQKTITMMEEQKNKMEEVNNDLQEKNIKIHQLLKENQEVNENFNDTKLKLKQLEQKYEKLKTENQEIIEDGKRVLVSNLSKYELENVNLRKIIEERNEQIQQHSSIKQAYEKLLEENNKYITEIHTMKYKREKDREEYVELLSKERNEAEIRQQKKIMEIVTDNENKLEKMKEKMLKVYREQLESYKNEQPDVAQTKYLKSTIDELRQQLNAAQRKIEILESNNRGLYHSRESVLMDRAAAAVPSIRGKGNKVADRDSMLKTSQSATFPLRIKSNIGETASTTSRKSSVSSVRDIGKNFQMEDEDEFNEFNPKYLTDLKEGRCPIPLDHESSASRMSELAWRNSMVPPHLKSSYPAETQCISPRRFKEEDLKVGNVNLDDSYSKLIPNDKVRQKKDFGTTSYKKPGPPTPSKNAGRMSLQGNEMQPPLNVTAVPLKECNVPSSTPKRLTPSRIKSLFTSRKDNTENITPRTSGRKSFFKLRKN